MDKELSVTKNYSFTMETIGMAADLGERSGLGASKVLRTLVKDFHRRAEEDPALIEWLKQQAEPVVSQE